MSSKNVQNRKDDQQSEKTPSLGRTIAKVAVGAVIAVVGLDDLAEADISGFLIFLIIGAAFIAWGLIPYLQAKKKEKQEETEAILNAPFPGEKEKDEAEILAEKYYNK